MFSRILFPTDGSDLSREAASSAAEIAGKLNANVTILHVVHKSGMTTRVGISTGASGGVATGEISAVVLPEPSSEEESGGKTAQSMLGQMKRVFQEAGVRSETLLEHGHPGNVVCKAAEDGKFDLIIMSSRGEGKGKRFLMGSISYHVARNAKCPVLLVR